MKFPDRQVITSGDVDARLGGAGAAVRRQADCDCACEASQVTVETAPASGIQDDTRLRPSPGLYQDATTVPGHRIVFNPLAGQGVSLLTPLAAQIFDQMDGERPAAALAAALPGDPTATRPVVQEILARLVAARLVYTGDRPPQPMPRPPTHLGVWLHVTNQCNLRCTYCYVSKTNEQLPVALGQRALRAVFDAARSRGMTELTLKYAGGEALLEAATIWALDDYARTLAGESMAVQSTILTNGTPLRPPLIEEIRRRGFRLAISLDGLGAAHDAQRPTRAGQPSFRLVRRGLDLAVAAGLEISVSVVVGPGNLATLPDLVDYLLDRNLFFTLNFLRDSDAVRVHLPEHDAALIAAMNTVYERIARRPPTFSLMNAALDRVQLEHPHFAACGIGESYVVVRHTGEVSSCQMLLAQPIGHIRRGDVLTQVAQHTRERPHGTTVDDHEGCRSCQWRYRCAGGCPVITFATHGRFDRRSPFCGVYKALIPRLVALEGLRIARYSGIAASPS